MPANPKAIAVQLIWSKVAALKTATFTLRMVNLGNIEGRYSPHSHSTTTNPLHTKCVQKGKGAWKGGDHLIPLKHTGTCAHAVLILQPADAAPRISRFKWVDQHQNEN